MRNGKLLLLVLAFALIVLGGCQKEETEYWGLNAEIVAIDSENQLLCVKDLGEAGIFGEECYIDSSEAIAQHKILYCNYETHEVKEIAFSDLEINDEIILNIEQTELEQIGKGEAIKAKQIQLGTQRLE